MNRTITVGICGAQPRLGTTTQALQLVEYLQMMGYDAAYAELADQDYIEDVRKLYRDILLRGKCVIYEQIPMYRSIIDANADSEQYDFLVKDYGAMSDEDFNKTSFLEQDIKIICGGVKPNEIFKMTDILKKPEYEPAKLIFTFVPNDQRPGILGMMGERAEATYFANYNPDPFSYDATMNKTYRSILGKYMIGADTQKKRKQSLQEWMHSASRRFRQLEDQKRVRITFFVAYSLFLIGVFIWLSSF